MNVKLRRITSPVDVIIHTIAGKPIVPAIRFSAHTKGLCQKCTPPAKDKPAPGDCSVISVDQDTAKTLMEGEPGGWELVDHIQKGHAAEKATEKV